LQRGCRSWGAWLAPVPG